MNFDTYQIEAKKTAQFPKAHAVTYPALGLSNEAGEFLEKFLNHTGVSDEDVLDELGDVVWYMQAMCDIGLISMEEVFINAKPIEDFYDPTQLFYTVARINGLAKKAVRDRDGVIDREKLYIELKSLASQLLTFLPNLSSANKLVTINDVMAKNIAKLRDRQARGKIKGDGDKR